MYRIRHFTGFNTRRRTLWLRAATIISMIFKRELNE